MAELCAPLPCLATRTAAENKRVAIFFCCPFVFFFNLLLLLRSDFQSKNVSVQDCVPRRALLTTPRILSNLYTFSKMVWYGMVWYGMVWYGMVW